MSACEHCWSSAYTIARMTGRSQVEVYRELIAASPRSHGDELARLHDQATTAGAPEETHE